MTADLHSSCQTRVNKSSIVRARVFVTLAAGDLYCCSGAARSNEDLLNILRLLSQSLVTSTSAERPQPQFC